MSRNLRRGLLAAAAGIALTGSGLAGAGTAGAAPGAVRLPASGAALPASFAPVAASFLTPARGFVLGGSGCTAGHRCRAMLAATSDGGGYWHLLAAPDVRTSPYAPRGTVTRVLFAAARTGWLYGPALWSTHDGGAHWRKLSLGGAVKAMAAAGGRVYAVVTPPGGQRSELYASPAFRDAWARVGRIAVQPFTALAVSGTAAWLTGSSRVWATADGRAWHRYPVRCPAPYNRDGVGGVAAASRSQVYFLCLSDAGAGSQPKAVLYSADGGRTQHLAGIAPSHGTGISPLAVPPGRPQVITLGTVFSLDRSADGGKTWKQALSYSSGATWNSLSFVSRTTGWAVVTSVSGQLLRTIDAGRTWHQIRFTRPPDPVTAYVVNAGSGTVTPIRAATGKPLKAIRVGTNPAAIAITPDGKTAYVVNSGSGTVTPIRVATNKAGRAIRVGKDPRYIAIPRTARLPTSSITARTP
jgi:YVTN family beta-propeller protein